MDGRRPRSRPGAAGAAMEGDVDGDASLAKASPTFEVDDNFANPLAAAVGASVRVRDVGKQASTDARRFIARRGRGSWPCCASHAPPSGAGWRPALRLISRPAPQ